MPAVNFSILQVTSMASASPVTLSKLFNSHLLISVWLEDTLKISQGTLWPCYICPSNGYKFYSMVQQTWVLFLVLWCESRRTENHTLRALIFQNRSIKEGFKSLCVLLKSGQKTVLVFSYQNWKRIQKAQFLGPSTLLNKMDVNSLQKKVTTLMHPLSAEVCSKSCVGQDPWYPRVTSLHGNGPGT